MCGTFWERASARQKNYSVGKVMASGLKTVVESKDYLLDSKNLIQECLDKRSVAVVFARDITKQLYGSGSADQIFGELFRENRLSDIHERFSNGKDLLKFCGDLLVAGGDREDDWLLLGRFYRNLGYSFFTNLLFRYDISVDKMSLIDENEDIQKLFVEIQTKTQAEFVTSGLFLAPNVELTDENTSRSDFVQRATEEIAKFNKEVAQDYFWKRELLQFYFFD